MGKKLIPVICSANGDIIAEEVYNCYGAKLISKHTMINEYIKGKLHDLGIKNIWIFEESIDNPNRINRTNFEEIKKEYIISIAKIKKMLINISSGKVLDIDTVSEVSNLIFSSADESGCIVECINEIRNSDEYTYEHCINMSFYAMLIGKWLGLTEKDIKNVIKAGLIHDIGKTRIPKIILNKKEKLTVEEFNEIKKHTTYGYEIVKNEKGLDQAIKDVVLMHHERMDGSGYPQGVDGQHISLYTKIITIADVYDAMTSDRVYKKGITPFEVFEMFMIDGIRIFDIDVLKTFLEHISACYIGAKVMLSTGDIGTIVYVPPYDIANPVIQSYNDFIDISKESDLSILKVI